MTTLISLAERVEKLTGPDREVDIAICAATGDYSKSAFIRYSRSEPSGSTVEQFLRGCLSTRYTGSIDDALTLVPEGFASLLWTHGRTTSKPFACVSALEPINSAAPHLPNGIHNAHGETLAIALCVAALRARAEMEKRNG